MGSENDEICRKSLHCRTESVEAAVRDWTLWLLKFDIEVSFASPTMTNSDDVKARATEADIGLTMYLLTATHAGRLVRSVNTIW